MRASPQRNVSEIAMTEVRTDVEIYVVERTSKGKIRPEEQSAKAESCGENLWNEIQLKGPYRQKATPRAERKRVGQARLVYVET